MRKRIVTLLMAVLCVCLGVAVFAACGEKNDDDNTSYTVTYVGGDGATGTAPTEAAHKKGETFTVAQNTFVKDGFDFKNWSDGDKAYEAGAQYTMPAKNVTFTATWEVSIPEYNITFSLGEGATGTAPETLVKTTGDKITLPQLPTGAAKTGYTFKAWSDGTVEYAAGAEYTVGTSAVTFTAVWVPASIEGTWTGSILYDGPIVYVWEMSIAAAPATSDADYYMILKVSFMINDTPVGEPELEFRELKEMAGQTGVYDLDEFGTLKFADNKLTDHYTLDSGEESEVEFEYTYIPNATLSDGKWWTALSIDGGYEYNLYEAVVAGANVNLTITTNNSGDYGIRTPETAEGTLAGIGNYVVFLTDDFNVILIKDGATYTVNEYGVAIKQGNTVSYTVSMSGVANSERIVWGGLSLGEVDTSYLNKKAADAQATQSTDWYDGTTLVDYSYVPTKNVTLTPTNVAKYPSNVSFMHNGGDGYETISLPDARIKSIMTYDATAEAWKLTMPTPDKFGFVGATGYQFAGWRTISEDVIEAGQTVTLTSGTNRYTAVWDFPLLGQWKSGSKKLVIIPVKDLIPDLYPKAVAQFILFDTAATNATPAVYGRIEQTANGYVIAGVEGYSDISFANDKITIGTTAYDFETKYEDFPEGWGLPEDFVTGLYECTGKVGFLCQRDSIDRYENGKALDDGYIFFGNYGVIVDAVMNGLYIVYPSATDAIIVADLAAGSYAKYTAPAAITVTLDLNGGTAEFWSGTHNPPYTLETFKGQMTYITLGECDVSKEVAGLPIPMPLVGWATRTGTAGNYVYELLDEDEAVMFFADTTVYAVYGYTVVYNTIGNASTSPDVDTPDRSYVDDTLKFTVDAKDLKTNTPGYKFKGWALDVDETDATKLYHYGDVITLTADQIKVVYGTVTVHLYAIWEITAKPEVTFSKGYFGGAESNDPTAQISDTMNANGKYVITLPSNTYTREGYHFVGWDIDGTTYQPGATYEASPGEEVFIRALWEADT